MEKKKSFIQQAIDNHSSLIRRVLLYGVATLSMINSMGALTHGSLAQVCESEIKYIDKHLNAIQEEYQEYNMVDGESFGDKLARDYTAGKITLEEYRSASRKIVANNFVDALMIPSNVDESYKNEIEYSRKQQAKLAEKKKQHQIGCATNAGMFAVTGGASLALLKKRWKDIDDEYSLKLTTSQELLSKK